MGTGTLRQPLTPWGDSQQYLTVLSLGMALVPQEFTTGMCSKWDEDGQNCCPVSHSGKPLSDMKPLSDTKLSCSNLPALTFQLQISCPNLPAPTFLPQPFCPNLPAPTLLRSCSAAGGSENLVPIEELQQGRGRKQPLQLRARGLDQNSIKAFSQNSTKAFTSSQSPQKQVPHFPFLDPCQTRFSFQRAL